VTIPANEPPNIVDFQGPRAFRVVSLSSGPVIELADGKDALGETRWVKALLVPDRRGLNEPVYEGWKEISAALGCSVRTAIRYARESFNPLPVLYGVNEKPFIVRPLVRAWLTSRTSSQAPVMKGKRKA
jgi:hypothetical protein